MCSNTSSGSYGDPKDYSGACLKKQKKEKVPRRGPGVAELEKILREQEKNCSALPDPSPPFFSPSYSSLPRNVMDQSIFGPPLPPPPPLATAFYYSSDSFRPATTDGSCNAMPNISLPEKSPVFPMMFVSSRPNNDVIDTRDTSGFSFSSYFSNGSLPKDLIPLAPVFQRKQQVQMMNLPQHVAVPPLTNRHPMGLYQFIEPPSNQRSCPTYTSQLLEEDKIVGAKRPWNFLADISANTQMNTKCNVRSTKLISRDAKHGCFLNLGLKSSVPDYEATSGNPITVDSPSPATPPTPVQTCPRDFSNSKLIPLTLQYEVQENIEEYVQRRTGANISVNRQPFYSFLPSDEQSGDKEHTFGLKSERYEVNRDHGIDLNLKL